jgi:hypothetical protein
MRACMWRAVPVTPRHMVFLLCGHRPSLHAEGLRSSLLLAFSSLSKYILHFTLTRAWWHLVLHEKKCLDGFVADCVKVWNTFWTSSLSSITQNLADYWHFSVCLRHITQSSKLLNVLTVLLQVCLFVCLLSLYFCHIVSFQAFLINPRILHKFWKLFYRSVNL